jgi:putative tryptophan/tyrosine transport system substrate-binding protein
MQRREFISLLGGAAAWPLCARAQQPDRMRRIVVLQGLAADDPEAQTYVRALQQGLQEAGWIVGHNVRIDYRWSAGDDARLRRNAAELVALNPDVIVAGYGPTSPILHRLTRTVPIVFAQGVDPVGSGVVESLARPAGNLTGFTMFEYGLSVKWLELLKEVAPHISHVGVVRNVEGSPVGIGQWAVLQTFAAPMGVELRPVNLRDLGETERTVSAFVGGANSGLIVIVGVTAAVQRDLIIALAARHRLPAVYFNRIFVDAGGLMSYGANVIEQYRRTAAYVDRILKGEKPADLPVQAPTKYELVINLKTAKALGLEVPPSLLTRADEVIE